MGSVVKITPRIPPYIVESCIFAHARLQVSKILWWGGGGFGGLGKGLGLTPKKAAFPHVKKYENTA